MQPLYRTVKAISNTVGLRPGVMLNRWDRRNRPGPRWIRACGAAWPRNSPLTRPPRAAARAALGSVARALDFLLPDLGCRLSDDAAGGAAPPEAGGPPEAAQSGDDGGQRHGIPRACPPGLPSAAAGDGPPRSRRGERLPDQHRGNRTAFLSQLLLARVLGVAGYGAYAYVMAWVTVLALLATLGFQTGMLRFVSAYCAREEWPLLRGVLRYAMQRVSLAGLTIGIVTAGVVLALGDRLGTGVAGTFLVGCAIVLVLALSQVRESIARRLAASHWRSHRRPCCDRPSCWRWSGSGPCSCRCRSDRRGRWS